MKHKLTLLLIFIALTTSAQMKTEFEKDNLKVTFGDKIDSNKMSIKLSQGTWNVTLFPIFENNQIIKNTFPKEIGIYILSMNYSSELFYTEVVLYKTEPKFEKLSFDFYQDCGRIFCNIHSEIAPELNKEIVLNKIDDELNKLLKVTE